MLKIQTFRITPYLKHGQSLPYEPEAESQWLRELVNSIMRPHQKTLEANGLETRHFFNHDTVSGESLTLYPHILYHYADQSFYVTALNEGLLAMTALLKLLKKSPISINGMLVDFEALKPEKIEVKIQKEMYSYRLTNWLPFRTADINKSFVGLRAVSEKIQFLEKLLAVHVKNDFAKYLQLPLQDAQLSITDFGNLHRPQMKVMLGKHPHYFQPISLAMDINVNLPEFVCLGNNKALGYGRIMRLTAPSTPT